MTTGGRASTAHALANVVADHAARSGYSTRRLAAEIGMSRATLTRRLNGSTHLTVEELGRIAAATGTTAAELIARAS